MTRENAGRLPFVSAQFLSSVVVSRCLSLKQRPPPHIRANRIREQLVMTGFAVATIRGGRGWSP
jgi:hypothetical protein